MSELIIEIKPDGAVTVSVEGMKGSGCKDVTKAIEKALGTTQSTKPTKEMSEVQKNAQRIRM